MTTECEYCRGLDQCPLCAIDNERLVKDNAALIADVERLQKEYKEVEKERDQAQADVRELKAFQANANFNAQHQCARIEALTAERDTLKAKYDELHDQRHEEARKADALKAEVERLKGDVKRLTDFISKNTYSRVESLKVEFAAIKSALEAELAEWKTDFAYAASERDQTRARVAELEEWKSRGWYDRESILEERRKTTAAVAALKKYGRHTEQCDLNNCNCWLDAKCVCVCTCGLADSLKEDQ